MSIWGWLVADGGQTPAGAARLSLTVCAVLYTASLGVNINLAVSSP